MIPITKIITPTNMRIFDMFINNPYYVANITSLFKMLSLSPQTVHAHMDNMVEANIIKKQIASETPLYVLNYESQQTKAFMHILEIYESAFKDVEVVKQNGT